MAGRAVAPVRAGERLHAGALSGLRPRRCRSTSSACGSTSWRSAARPPARRSCGSTGTASAGSGSRWPTRRTTCACRASSTCIGPEDMRGARALRRAALLAARPPARGRPARRAGDPGAAAERHLGHAAPDGGRRAARRRHRRAGPGAHLPPGPGAAGPAHRGPRARGPRAPNVEWRILAAALLRRSRRGDRRARGRARRRGRRDRVPARAAAAACATATSTSSRRGCAGRSSRRSRARARTTATTRSIARAAGCTSGARVPPAGGRRGRAAVPHRRRPRRQRAGAGDHAAARAGRRSRAGLQPGAGRGRRGRRDRRSACSCAARSACARAAARRPPPTSRRWRSRRRRRWPSRARCPPATPRGRRAPGWVTLVIMPHSAEPRPYPSFGLREAVRRYVAARAPADLPADRIVVIGPDYQPVDVTATIVPVDLARRPARSSAPPTGRSPTFLHPLLGGPSGRGWRPGQSVFASDVAAVIEHVDGVDYTPRARAAARRRPGRRAPRPAGGPHPGRRRPRLGMRRDVSVFLPAAQPRRHALERPRRAGARR